MALTEGGRIAIGELRLRWRLGIGLLKILASCENEVA